MRIGYPKEIRKLTFQALALRQSRNKGFFSCLDKWTIDAIFMGCISNHLSHETDMESISWTIKFL